MRDYVPPLRDIRFVLEQLVDLDGLVKLEAYAHADINTVFGVIEESGRFMADVAVHRPRRRHGIQAIDLVTRKAPMRGGAAVADLLAQVEATGRQLDAAGPELAGMQPELAAGVRAMREATDWIISRGSAEAADALAGATPYLRLSGLVIGGWLMARSALAASRLLGDASGPGAVFLQDKIGTARSYIGQLLPQAAGLLPAITAGAGQLAQVDLGSAALG